MSDAAMHCKTVDEIGNLAQKKGKDIERSAIAFTLGYVAGIKHKTKRSTGDAAQSDRKKSISRTVSISHGQNKTLTIHEGDCLSDLQKTLAEKFQVSADRSIVGFSHAPSKEYIGLRVALHDPTILREDVSYSLLLGIPATTAETEVTLEPTDIFACKSSVAAGGEVFSCSALISQEEEEKGRAKQDEEEEEELEDKKEEEEVTFSTEESFSEDSSPTIVRRGEGAQDRRAYAAELATFQDAVTSSYKLGTQVGRSFTVDGSELVVGPLSENGSIGLSWDATVVAVLDGDGDGGSVFAPQPTREVKPVAPRERLMCGNSRSSLHRWRALAPGKAQIRYQENYRGTPRGDTHVLEIRVSKASGHLQLEIFPSISLIPIID